MTNREILFIVLLTLFILTAIITLLGVLKIIVIDDFYLKGLFGAFLLELAATIYSIATKGNLLDAETPLPEKKESIDSNEKDFDIPSMLIVHRYDTANQDGSFPYSSLRVLTLRSLTDENFKLRIHRRSLNVVEHEESISDVVDTTITGVGTNAALSEKEYSNNHPGKQYINVSEARWSTKIGIRSIPNNEDFIQNTLFKKFLVTPLHDYMGGRIVRFTSHFRQLIYFPEKSYIPRKFKMVQIYESGDYKEYDPRVELVEKDNLVILEVDNISGYSGLYTYWKWDESILSDNDKSA